jgi:amino acid adenylation domain-containing protein
VVASAESGPDAVHLTYAQLNRRANRLAHTLRPRGVGPNTLVGLFVDRSPAMLIGMLAVLKAGGAYLPLDPAFPPARLSALLADSQIETLLTRPHLRGQLSSWPGKVLSIDDASVSGIETNPHPAPSPANLAYVLYTSGSTGQPKGVMVEHQAVVNYVQAAAAAYHLGPTDRVLQFAAFSWDTSIEEIFPTLACGGAVVLRTQAMLASMPAFLDACRSLEINVLNLPTAFWHELTAQLTPALAAALPPSLRLVIIGGEAARPDRLTHWQRLIGSRLRLVNTYGLTEAAAVSIQGDLSAPVGGTDVPLGRPLPHVQALLLDDDLRPVRPGQTGQLHLGGGGLARGYLHQPDLTAEKFIKTDSGLRLLKTGDLARQLPDGRLVFAGRADHQVKIRGHRVELGELEAALRRHPAVQEAAVAARTDLPGSSPTLAAYVVPRPPHAFDEAALRHFLRQQLPDFMQPAALAALTALPLTSTGKIDRRALPAPNPTGPAFTPPATPTQQTVAAIWAEVLGLEQVSAGADFFALGGDSLLATRVVARLQQEMGVSINLSTLFDAPTVAALAAYLDTLPAAPLPESAPPPLPGPLSFAQERLWFLEQLHGPGPVHNISLALRLTGPLDVPALEQSLTHLARRHDSLRAAFAAVEGRPVARVAAPEPVPLAYVNLHPTPALDREAELCRRLAADACRPFDLARGPLLRATLLKLAPQEHVLLLVIHHLITDDGSNTVLLRELGQIYAALAQGQPVNLPEPPAYTAYAAGQRAHPPAESLAYWETALAGAPPALNLPTDHPRPARPSLAGAAESLRLPAALLEQLKVLARQENATLFMTMLAAFDVLLYRYTGQADLVVGVPIAGRSRPDTLNMVGLLVNTLALRVNMAGGPAFQTLLAQVRQTVLAAFRHQDAPFEQLVQRLQPQRDLSRHPLFQTMFVFEQNPAAELRLPGLAVQPVEVEPAATAFDLTLFVQETAAGLALRLEYSPDLFEADTVRRMLGHYHTLLAGLAAQPHTPVTHLPLLTPAEQRQLLVDWNNTAAAYPHHLCAHQLFEAQAQKTPDAVAVVAPGHGQWTYRQLNHRANQLAHHLQHLGVGPDTRVGVCLDRSPDLVAALLAVLKAGGAYVPLDPGFPPERLAFMLADARAAAVITRAALAGPLFPPEARPAACALLLLENLPAGQPETTPTCPATSANLAYVIYTSGSTGQPKGVMIEHRALVNYLTWAARAYPHNRGTGAPVHSTISFDLTITGLFGPLLAGQAVYLLPEESPVDALAHTLRDRGGFSLVKLTPGHLKLLAGQLAPVDAATAAHAFVIGGENLLAEDLAFWRWYAPNTVLVNEYGPTEATVGCIVHTVDASAPTGGAVPIGRPIANTQVYVLDDHLQPTPIGVPGELYLGGHSLARGYLNRPELTAKKFIRHPYSDDPAARLYRTGDLARYRPDGVLEFLGRRDRQVKLRGYRLEPAEVEAALTRHPAVRAAVAVVRAQPAGYGQLAAYVVFEPGRSAGTADLRRFLARTLPDYMLPAAIVSLPALPLTANGKVNVNVLPPPGRDNLEHSAFSPPQNDVQQQLAALWEQALGVQPIGITDNFFDLGGHSLLAVRLFAQIEQAMGLKLPVAALFQAPTVAELADLVAVRRNGHTEAWSSLVPIQPQGSRPPFFCVHGMGGGVLDYTNLARRLGPNQPFYGLQDRGLAGNGEPFNRVEDMAAHYVQEIRTFQPTGPYFVGGYCFGGTVAFEIARQLQAAGQPVALLAIMDNTAPGVNLHRAVWSRAFAVGFGQNLPYWLLDFVQLNPRQMLARLFRKTRFWANRLAPGRGALTTEPATVDIEAVIDNDLTRIPADRHPFLAAHYKALIAYQPPAKSYPGPVTLFRTRGHSLFGPFDHDLGWGRLASGGVSIRQIPGFHANILREPHVAPLAAWLARCLDEAG